MIIFLILICFVTGVVSWVLSLAARRLALAAGHVDRPALERKQHEKPVPYGGGAALIVTFLLVCGVFFAMSWIVPTEWLPDILLKHYQGFSQRVGQLFIIIGAGVLIGCMGFTDDITPVPEWLKLIIHLTAAALMWFIGFRITLHISSNVLSFAVTVLWITGITNAFNFLDNMDGLSSGVAFISSVIFAVFGFQTGQLFIAGYFSVLAGAVLGFLVLNFPPASMFLGDCGSLFIGFLIAMGAVVSTFYTSEVSNKVFPLFVPLLILAVPIFDAVSVVFIRIKKKKHLLRGDRNHFSHRLLRLGMSQKTVVFTIYLVTAGIGISALYLVRLTVFGCILALFQAVCIFLIIVLLEHAGMK